MLEIEIPSKEGFNAETNEFFTIDSIVLRFEHSLISLSKWEQKYKKFFLGNRNITSEELLDYFRCMYLDGEFPEEYWSNELVEQLSTYLQYVPSATTIQSDNDSNSRRIMTSEVIYAYMANAQIPFSCETWNLHRLLLLLGVIGSLNSKPKKLSQKEIMKQNAALNEARLREAQRRAESMKSH